MRHRFKARIAGVLLLCSMILVSTIFYFLISFDMQQPKNFPQKFHKRPMIVFNFEEHKMTNDSLEQIYEKQIMQNIEAIFNKPYFDIDPDSDTLLKTLKNNLKVHESDQNKTQLIKVSKSWIRARQIVPEHANELGDIIHILQTSRIISSDVYRQGTQLKLLITLEDGLQAIVKPQRYSRDYVAENSHSGSDRHNAEIVAFHVSRLLDFRANPIVSSRRLNVFNEIKNLSTESLRKTFLEDEQKLCFYGECYYCNEYDPVCPDQFGNLETAFIMILPKQYRIEAIKNPWQRTYRSSIQAKWQIDDHFCLEIKKSYTDERILDFIDSSIFDFIIGNSDRHHYDVWKDVQNSALLLIDNGKGFANPKLDELSILFPLLQCCQIRKKTYERLKYLSNYKTEDLLAYLVSNDILWPLIISQHYEAMDRRIRIVLESVALCQNKTNTNVIIKL